MLHEVSQRDQAIVTLEDPVEYAVDGITQIGIHESQGLDFAVGIKSILRLDPDIILVGEMRDAVSAQAVAEAAASGHIVLSTLHGSSPPDVLSLLQSWGLTGHQIAATTRLILCQRLIRRLCGKCGFRLPRMKQNGPGSNGPGSPCRASVGTPKAVTNAPAPATKAVLGIQSVAKPAGPF